MGAWGGRRWLYRTGSLDELWRPFFMCWEGDPIWRWNAAQDECEVTSCFVLSLYCPFLSSFLIIWSCRALASNESVFTYNWIIWCKVVFLRLLYDTVCTESYVASQFVPQNVPGTFTLWFAQSDWDRTRERTCFILQSLRVLRECGLVIVLSI